MHLLPKLLRMFKLMEEHYNGRVWWSLRFLTKERKVQLLGGRSVVNEYSLGATDITQPLTLAMKFSTPSGEDTSMEIEEITVNSYSNEARGTRGAAREVSPARSPTPRERGRNAGHRAGEDPESHVARRFTPKERRPAQGLGALGGARLRP